MDAVIVLEWKFSPPDYFEEPITISRDDYIITIDNGRIEARIDSAKYDPNPSLRGVLHDALNDRFLGVQLLTHKPYELSKPTMTRVRPDGHRDYFDEIELFALSGVTVDFQVIDKNGNVVTDSRRDRIEGKKTLADLISTYRASDAILASLIHSHNAAVHDANNELVHL